MTIQKLAYEYRFKIGLVLVFVLLENVAWIIEPGYFGKLLDRLIDYFYDHEKVNYLKPLFIWIFIYLLNVVGGTMHRFLSGRIYSKMFADVAEKVIILSRKQKDPVSRTLIRAELTKEFVVFFKERLPEVSWQFCATFGAIIAMFFYDWRIAAVCLVVVVPLYVFSRFYRRNVLALQRNIRDTQEDLYKVVENRSTASIHEFYRSMVGPQFKIARWNSFNYLVIKIILMGIFIVVLFICVDVDNFSTGSIYSIVAYLWTFISSAEYLPGLMESYSSVKELGHRLKEEDI
ncbi:MAG: ABC transporter six-transmembrane domain-containing protein [Bacteroidetes bacterium]|nr:ABC transporter six-transmembrane domain-containing protein [Bacteroidota bacterium]